MMNTNNFYNNLPQNYNVPFNHSIPINSYFYKDFPSTHSTIDTSVSENSLVEVNSLCNNSIVESDDVKSEEISNNTVVKKYGNKENYDKLSQRLRRLRGESYIDSKGRKRPARPLKPALCRGKPKHKGCEEVTDEDRNLIYTEFRHLKSNQAQWQFIASHLLICFKKRNTGGNDEKPSRREFTHNYFLTARGKKCKVCRGFFLSTLNITESLIKTSLSKLSLQGVCQDDKRGRRTPQNKLSEDDENFIRDHILSFPTYNKRNTRKKYLDAGLSVAEMHKLYLTLCSQKCKRAVSLEKYRQIFKEYGLFFFKPKSLRGKKLKKTIKEDSPIQTNNSQFDENNFIYEPIIQQSPIMSDYQPNGEDFILSLQDRIENTPIPAYFTQVETSKVYDGKIIADLDRPEYSAYYSSPQPNFTELENCSNNSFFYTPNKQTFTPVMNDSNSQKKTCIFINRSTVLPTIKKIKKCVSGNNLSLFNKLRGESYTDSKGRLRPAKPMKPAPCRGKWKHYSCDKVTDDDRMSIYREFRQLNSYQAQWQFVACHVTAQTKSRSTSEGPSRREKTYVYYLTAQGEKIRVCREFFLATLNITESLVKTAINKLSPQGICQEDKRGKRSPKNKICPLTDDFLRKHILSFPITTKKNSNKRYLSPDLTMIEMYKLYTCRCIEEGRRPVSVEKYRIVCKEYNLVSPKSKKIKSNKSLNNKTVIIHDFNNFQDSNFVNQDYDERTYKNSPHSGITENGFRNITYMPQNSSNC